jgi:hypothetical protein
MVEDESDQTHACITLVHDGRWIRAMSTRVEARSGEAKASTGQIEVYW